MFLKIWRRVSILLSVQRDQAQVAWPSGRQLTASRVTRRTYYQIYIFRLALWEFLGLSVATGHCMSAHQACRATHRRQRPPALHFYVKVKPELSIEVPWPRSEPPHREEEAPSRCCEEETKAGRHCCPRIAAPTCGTRKIPHYPWDQSLRPKPRLLPSHARTHNPRALLLPVHATAISPHQP